MIMEKQSDPLHLAAREGDSGKIREILKAAGDNNGVKQLLTKRNSEGETALYLAAENGHVAAVAEILRHLDFDGASLAARSGLDPFHIAAKQGHLGKIYGSVPR